MYVSYDFYAKTFGNAIPEDAFPQIVAKAEAAISYLTYPNGDIFAKADGRVSLAVCAAAETVFFAEQAGTTHTPALKSENNDGYSVTYVAEGQDGQTAEVILRKKILESVRPYLLPTGWLSRNLRGGCHHVHADPDCSL